MKPDFHQLEYICKILGIRGDEYEECRLLGCGAARLLQEPSFGGMYRLHQHGEKSQRLRYNVWNN
jgi:hypothetical protein